MLKAAGLIVAGTPASSAACPGCAEGCVRPVEVLPRQGRASPSLFIVCDLREDINRVPVAEAALERWLASEQRAADALARMLNIHAPPAARGTDGVYRLGMATGRETREAVHLRWEATGPVLLVAGHALELPLVLSSTSGVLALNMRALARCVDAPVTGEKPPDETPAQRTERFHVRKRELLARGVVGFNKQIAAEEGISVSMVKRILERPSASTATTLEEAWQSKAAQPRGVPERARRKP